MAVQALTGGVLGFFLGAFVTVSLLASCFSDKKMRNYFRKRLDAMDKKQKGVI